MIVKNECEQGLEFTLITTSFAKQIGYFIDTTLPECDAVHVIEGRPGIGGKTISGVSQFTFN